MNREWHQDQADKRQSFVIGVIGIALLFVALYYVGQAKRGTSDAGDPLPANVSALRASCNNGRLDGDEVGIDRGGSCASRWIGNYAITGQKCKIDRDCWSVAMQTNGRCIQERCGE